jgi:outer membrane protein assembly factor BamB
VEWNENKNIRWKVKIPGKGSSSPIVWGERIFVLAAIPTDKLVEPQETEKPPQRPPRGRRRRPGIEPTTVQKFSILAIERRTGKILWQRTAKEELPHEGTHLTGTWASNSPVTDGKHVYAYFGSRGLYCYDMEGNLVWSRDFGNMTIRLGFGEGSSPTLHDDKIIVNWDHEGQSFIVALNKETGEEIWRVNRDEITSWTTPIVVEYNGKLQVVTSATNRVRSYDLERGDLIWESSGMTLNTIPSPVAADGMVFATSGFRGNALLAIRLNDAQGDITESKAIVWTLDRDTPYVPSPLLYDETLYFLKRNSGILSCFNAKTGEEYYRQQRVEGLASVYASPVGAAGRVYIAGREGTTVVIQHGTEFKVLARNTLDEGFDASPLLSTTRFIFAVASISIASLRSSFEECDGRTCHFGVRTKTPLSPSR